MRLINLEGQKFGKLTALSRAEDHIFPNGKKGTQWECECECGKRIKVLTCHLRSGHTKSCGCSVIDRRLKNEYKEKDVKQEKSTRVYNNYKQENGYMVGYTRKGIPFYFDKEDYGLVSQYCWYLGAHGYIMTTRNGERIKLHRLIMDAPPRQYVDHINHDKADNRRCNLRMVSPSENQYNKSMGKNNTTGRTGVYYEAERNKYRVSIVCNYKKYNIGRYDSFEEAVKAREEAEQKYFGEYAYNNSIASVPIITE